MQWLAALDELPLWAVYLAIAVTLWFSVEMGGLLGRAKRKRSEKQTESSVGAMVGGTLGLLAFLLAFTFGMAASRFDNRRNLVLEEANAIGTTYLRTGLLPEPYRTETRRLLREYVELRLKGVRPEYLEEAIRRSEEVQSLLWSQAGAAGEKNPSPITALFIASLNELIDLHSKRVTVVLRHRIPEIIWIALYCVAIFSMLSIGYQAGLTGATRSLAMLTLILAFTMVLVLIMDLDRPKEALFRVSQGALVDVQKMITPPGAAVRQ